MADHKDHKEEAAAASSSSSAAAAGFVYAGGEFADDAPYVEELHGLGVAGTTATFGQDADGSSSVDAAAASSGFGTLDTLLSSLLDGAEGDDGFDDADTCFSINAAASFAALVSPEEQIAELQLQSIESEQAQAAVDVLTPVEIMQLILLLQQFRVADYDSAASLPSSLRSLPLFCVSAAGPLRSRWFAAAEKQLMQGLSVLSIGLNRENVPAASAAATPATAAAPVVYSLLFRGSKVTSDAQLAAILSDLHALLALPDVVQPALLIKQLLAECARGVTEILQDVSAMSSGSNKPAASAASAAAAASADSADPIASLVTRLSSLQVSPVSSLPLSAPFALDLDSGLLTCPDFSGALEARSTPDQWDTLREIMGLKQEQDSGAEQAPSSSSSSISPSSTPSSSSTSRVLPRLLSYLFVETSRAVWSELVSQVRSLLNLDVDAASLAASLEPSVLLLLLLHQSAESPLAALLSADQPHAAAPAEFFARWLPASLESEVSDLAALESSSAAATARYLSLRTLAKQMAELGAQGGGLPSVPHMQRAILMEMMEQ